MIVWTDDRLPCWSQPGFDCIGNHGSCPVCADHGEDNHGISGG